MLNVGFFTYDFYPYIGGQGRFAFELYKQNKLYKEFNFYVFSPSDNELDNHIKIFPETLTSKLRNIDFSLKLNKKIHYLIDKYNIDVAHFQGGPGGVFLFKKLNIPALYTAHHTYWQQSHYISQQSWKKVFYYAEKRGYNLVDLVICDCDSTKQILIKHYNYDKKLVLIPIGIDLDKFTPVNYRNKLKTKEILYVGRIDKRKGVDFLIKTMEIVKKYDKDIHLNIVGKGKDKSILEKHSQDKNLNITFHNFLPDDELSRLYQKISLQIIPSIFEGFGLTVLEAMAKKIPVIATDVDAIRDIVKNNKNGMLVKYGNQNELAKKIIQLVNDKSLQDKFIRNGYLSLREYNWEEIYYKTLKVYNSLV